MARHAVVIAGAVANTVEIAPGNGYGGPGEAIQSDTAQVGDLWDGATFTAGPQGPVIAALRARLDAAIKTERDRRTQFGGYQAAGYWFHSDTFSRTQQIGLLLLGSNVPPGLLWRTMSGAFVAMTQTLAAQVFAAAAASDQALFGYAETLRAQVAAADDPTTIDIRFGWPAGFGE